MNLEPFSGLALLFGKEGNVMVETIREGLFEPVPFCFREKGASTPRRTTKFIAFGGVCSIGGEMRKDCFRADEFSTSSQLSTLRRPASLPFEEISCVCPNHTIP